MLTSAARLPYANCAGSLRRHHVAACGWAQPRDMATQWCARPREKPPTPAMWRAVDGSRRDADARTRGHAGRQAGMRGTLGVVAECRLASSGGWPRFALGFSLFSVRFSDPAHIWSPTHQPRIRFLPRFHLHRLRLLPLHATVPWGAS
jgi:hypothetical protein